MKTVKEIADKCGVSKTTVQRSIKELGISPYQHKNRYVFDDETADKIIEYIIPNFKEVSICGDNESDCNTAKQNDTKEKKIETTETENATNRTESQQLIEILRKQLEEKDNYIKDLSAKLDTQMEINKLQSQNIAFLNKSLEDRRKEDIETAETPKEESKSFFQRLFGL
jgi:hypothetical protein